MMSSTSMPKEFKKGFVPPAQKHEGSYGQQQFKLDPSPFTAVTADGQQYKPAGKLQGRCAIVTGGDSGIARATAVLFAMEGAQLTIAFRNEEKREAQETENLIKEKVHNAQIQLVENDLRSEKACYQLIEQHVRKWGRLDVLALNHTLPHAVPEFEELQSDQWRELFDCNIHSNFYLSKAALQQMKEGSSITFNASLSSSKAPQSMQQQQQLLDYSPTRGAIIGLMRILNNQVVGKRGIRVNAIAPGAVWTPLVHQQTLDQYGKQVPMERAGQPIEVATAFVYLSSTDSSYISGQVLNVNGGVSINQV